jgi:DNA-binding CsgD family transcriptional regulator
MTDAIVKLPKKGAPMTVRDNHEERFFNELKEYASLYPSVITRLRSAAEAGNPLVTRAVSMFAHVSRQSESGHIARCSARFDLTSAQARLALFLAEGGTIGEYAQVMGVKTSTVRTHLKSIFVKTGVKRQTELAILLLDRAR